MKTLLIIICAVAAVGCARLQPKEYRFDNTRTVMNSPERITENVLRWCAANGFNVTVNTGGVITATSDLRAIQRVNAPIARTETLCADCGENPDGYFVSSDGTMTVTVQPVDGAISATTVTVLFTAKPPKGVVSAYCASTGLIERMVLDAAAL